MGLSPLVASGGDRVPLDPVVARPTAVSVHGQDAELFSAADPAANGPCRDVQPAGQDLDTHMGTIATAA